MELRVLQYFLAIAREENISKAAEYLHITQPTLSRQMKELEEELGKTLFIRGNRKIILTEDGILLRKRAEEITNLVEKTELEMMANESVLKGDIYIGGGETDAMRFIARTVQQVQSIHPLIKVHLYSGNAQDVIEKLDNGLIDFGIILDPADMSKYDFMKLPAYDTWGVLMRKDSPLAQLEVITPADLLNQPIICSRQEMVSNELSGWMNGEFEKLNIIATYNLIYNASLMVEEGMGYALCLDKLVNTTGNSSLCFRPLSPTLTVGMALVWKKYQVFSRASQYFLKILRQQL
ncbi:MAG: LysR family transcriptional regulator [Coprobacillus cateniformis]|uniref:LysR family transcriptional regulator n=1 Tax=Longibaculum muris TaxID=1796628 RepID=UPI003AB560DF|nr:LysR family transcriptional regulator [Coprobacillus cateniformis]